MRNRLAALSLGAVLGLLPGLMTTMPAAPAPAPEQAKQPPAIYALVYVGFWAAILMAMYRRRIFIGI